MRKAVIIDDEVNSRELIATMLESYCEGVEVIGEARTVPQGIELIRTKAPDLVFLDVELPGGDGFDVLEAFENPSFEVVMISGHNPQQVRAFGFAAFAFLTKPVVLREFQDLVVSLPQLPLQPEQVQLYRELQSPARKEASRIILTGGKGYSSVEIRDIAYIEAHRAYSQVTLIDGGEHFTTFPLAHYEDLLPAQTFFRIHRSYLLNLSLVDRFDPGRAGQVHLKNGASLPLAIRRKADFIKRLQVARPAD